MRQFPQNSVIPILLCLFLLCLILINAAITANNEVWSHELDLESENGIQIRWRNSPESEGNRWLIMQVTAKTRGYVGIGFSPHGGMEGADIVIGWVDGNGKGYLKDFHGVTNGEPVLDSDQDYELISATENDQGTTLKFRRKWETCDENDMDIVKDTMRLIWAYSPSEPVVNSDGSVTGLQWHGAKFRGAVSTYIVDDAFAAKFPNENDPDVKRWDMRMENNEVDAEHTTYFCKILKLPPLERKHHMIGYRPILTPENKKNVHHIVFLECIVPPHLGRTEDVFERHLNNSGGRCYTPSMPPEWTRYCGTFLFVWVAGSEGEMLPQHVGNPLGEEHGGATYFMLELHYDNPELRSFKDSSGVQIYYTDKLREFDGSVLLLGYRITPFLLLPPSQKNFKIQGLCSSECTQNAIPEDGINIIITLVHAHLNGRKIRLRHFRNGTELPLIAQDNHYDFNFQQSRALKNEIKILRGDELIVECEYETANNDRIVLGGLSTTQEMCHTFLMYYPRIELSECSSQIEFHDFFKGLGIDKVSGPVLKRINMPYDPTQLSPEEQFFDSSDNAKELEETGDGASFSSLFDSITIENPNSLRGLTVGDYLKRVDWNDKSLDFGKSVEKKWKASNHYEYCTGRGGKRIPTKSHVISAPTIVEPLQKFSSICDSPSYKKRLIYRKSAAATYSNRKLSLLLGVTLFFGLILR